MEEPRDTILSESKESKFSSYTVTLENVKIRDLRILGGDIGRYLVEAELGASNEQLFHRLTTIVRTILDTYWSGTKIDDSRVLFLRTPVKVFMLGDAAFTNVELENKNRLVSRQRTLNSISCVTSLKGDVGRLDTEVLVNNLPDGTLLVRISGASLRVNTNLKLQGSYMFPESLLQKSEGGITMDDIYNFMKHF